MVLYGVHYFSTLHCIHIFCKMLKINFLKFFHTFPGFDFSSKNSISRKLLILLVLKYIYIYKILLRILHSSLEKYCNCKFGAVEKYCNCKFGAVEKYCNCKFGAVEKYCNCKFGTVEKYCNCKFGAVEKYCNCKFGAVEKYC